jgi:hypothetical protein
VDELASGTSSMVAVLSPANPEITVHAGQSKFTLSYEYSSSENTADAKLKIRYLFRRTNMEQTTEREYRPKFSLQKEVVWMDDVPSNRQMVEYLLSDFITSVARF